MAVPSENVRAVQQLYADFTSGNIPAILDRLAEDIEWHEPESGAPPFAGLHRGREAVARFFQDLAATAEPQQFEPREYLEHGDRVIAFGSYAFRSKATNRIWSTEWVMVWTFRGGKVSAFRIYKDSAAEVAALTAAREAGRG